MAVQRHVCTEQLALATTLADNQHQQSVRVQGRHPSTLRSLEYCRSDLSGGEPHHALLHIECLTLFAFCHEALADLPAATTAWRAAVEAASACPVGALQPAAREWLGGLKYKLGRLLAADRATVLEGEATLRQSLVVVHATAGKDSAGYVAGVRLPFLLEL